MTDKPVMEVTSQAEATREVEANRKAARLAALGGWPAQPMCSLGGQRKTVWAWTIATFFGAGFGKPGPGTWGSVAATLIFSGVVYFLHPAALQLLILTLCGICFAIALGVPAATIAARESGREDPGFVVIDEVAGVWITLLAAISHPDWKHIVLALLLFRVFDIYKPFPVRQIEKLPDGWGIVFDDVAAGLYAGAVLLVLSRWI